MAVKQTSDAGRFSYGESPCTPPLGGTSLHWWNNSVERPWVILNLFTTCSPVIQSPCLNLDWKRSTTEKEALRTNKRTILNTKMNSTTTKRTCLQWKVPGKADERNNKKRKEPYYVSTTEPQRKRTKTKKEHEKKNPTKKAAPASAKKKRTTKKKSYGDKFKGLKQNWKYSQHTQRSQPKH